jgi:hypothetical protein
LSRSSWETIDHAAAVVGGELAQQPGDVVAVAGIEVGGGLVGQDDAGVVGEGPGDGDALLLAAGELVGSEVQPLAKAQAGEQFEGSPPGSAAKHGGEVAGQFDVLEGVKCGEQVEVLEDETEVPGTEGWEGPVGSGGEVGAIDGDGTGRGAEHGAEHQQQGGLAAA